MKNTLKMKGIGQMEKIRTRGRGVAYRESIGERTFNVFNICFLILLSICMLYPMWYVLCGSFSDSMMLQRNSNVLLAPIGFNIQAYKKMLSHPLITSAYINSILIVVVGVSLNILFTSLCAYVLSRKNVMWNKFFTAMIIFTMFFGGGMIPTYLLVSQTLGLYDSFWSLVLPGTINVYNMIIMRTSFEGIPSSLEEAAKIDGAGHVRILFQVIMPLSKAILAVMVLYYAVAHWNAWFEASIYLKTREKYPLQLVLREILISNDTNSMANASATDQEAIGESIKYATIIYATVPILCVYPFLQKYFTKGVMIGAVKG